MSAPVATLPAADNDARPTRPVYYTTKSGAVAHATRSSRLASPSGIYVLVQHVADTYQPTEGGKAYRVELAAPGDDYVVNEVSAVELARLAQSGLRAAITRCEENAKAHDLAVGITKPGSVAFRLHTQGARDERDRARSLKAKLFVSAVQVPRVCACGKPAVIVDRCGGCDEDHFYGRHVPGAKLEGAE